MRKLFFLFWFVIAQVPMTGQQIYYYDAFQAQLYDNPATTGANGTSQARLSYQDWGFNRLGSTSYRQGHFFYDNAAVLQNQDMIGFGGGLGRERFGEIGFQNTSLNLLGAYHKRITPKNSAFREYLSIGTNATFIQNTIEVYRIIPTADPTNGHGQPDSTAGRYFRMLDIGLTYGAYWSDGQFVRLGFTKQGLMTTYPPSSRPNVLFLLARVIIANKIFAEPSIRYYSSRSLNVLNLGNNIGVQISKHSAVMAGFAWHDDHRYSINAGFQSHNIRAMFTYSWYSASHPLDFKGLEASLAYRFAKVKSRSLF